MGRKCSHCGNTGHNSRTCTNYRGNVGIVGLRLFGVHLDVTNYSSSTSIKRSFSMECLSSSTSSSPSSSSSLCSSRLSAETYPADKASIGYLSDGLFGHVQERKKGIAWTEGEHMAFLVGLEKLGKGDWRGISRSFVTSRTPTQVASHAQKYFLRLASLDKKKRRSSLFDMVGSGQSNPSSNSKPISHPLIPTGDDHQYLMKFKPRNITMDPQDCLVPFPLDHHHHHHMSTLPLLGLNSSQETHYSSKDQLMMLPGFGEFHLPKTSIATDQFSKPNVSLDEDDDDDDLELTLGVGAPSTTPTPTPLEGNKSPTSLLNTRHIRVT